MTWTFFVENFHLLVVLLTMCLMNKRGECYGNFTTLSHKLVIVIVKLCNLVDHSVIPMTSDATLSPGVDCNGNYIVTSLTLFCMK